MWIPASLNRFGKYSVMISMNRFPKERKRRDIAKQEKLDEGN
jgi:hypothetical protein